MKEYEYYITNIPIEMNYSYKSFTLWLDSLGKDGWQLVQIILIKEMIIFKRQTILP